MIARLYCWRHGLFQLIFILHGAARIERLGGQNRVWNGTGQIKCDESRHHHHGWPGNAIQTMPKDHQGLGLPFEVKVLAFMGVSLSISNVLPQHHRGIKNTDFSSNFSYS